MITFEQFLERVSLYPDEDQMRAINADVNCVVSAGAGSGKTMVLSYRFVRLVLERKARFDQILTLTFTRKAAREMHERIHDHLFLCTDDEEIRSQLASFSSAPISTIDAFCTQVLKGSAHEHGLSPEFQVDDEANLDLARRVAVELLEKTPQDRGARMLSILYSPDAIEEVLLSLSKKYPMGVEFEAKRVADEIRTKIREEYQRLRTAFEEFLVYYQNLVRGGTRTYEIPEKIAEFTQMWLKIFEEGEEEAILKALVGNLGYFDKIRSNETNESLVSIRESREKYLDIRKRLAVCAAFFLNEENLEPVVEFVAKFLEGHRIQKRAASIVTFADISNLAIKSLTDDKELRAFYKQAYRYIMIDEFQDNNEEQKHLLYLLAEKEGSEVDGIPSVADLSQDKLFFVGDEKQSIYRFRGSDVSVFKALAKELQGIGGMSVKLPKNYRSEPDLISWFNEIFPSIMKNESEPFEADFEPLEFREPKEGIDPKITLAIKPYVKNPEPAGEAMAEPSLAEAYHLAKKIRHILTSDEYLIPTKNGSPRKPEPNEIAILLRSTSNQYHLERALRLFSIPYTVQIARSLFLEAIINDFHAMLQLLIHPSDRLSYAVVLRSPFCFIDDSALVELLQSEELFTVVDTLSEVDKKKMVRMKHFFEDLKEAATVQRLERLIFMLWHESGYAHHYIQNPDYHSDIEHYELLYRLAQTFQEKGRTLSEFLDYLRNRLGRNERPDEMDLIKETKEGVQIMSVHKAKGLEFPIVIVANAGVTILGGGNSPPSNYPYPLPDFFDQMILMGEKGEEKQIGNIDELFNDKTSGSQELAELKRLLYVALTRAETHLIISGYFHRNNRNFKGKLSSFLQHLCKALGIENPEDPSLEHGKVRLELIEDVPSDVFYRDLEADVPIEELKPWYESVDAPYQAEALRYAVTALAPEVERTFVKELPAIASDVFLGEKECSALFGTFVHRLIEAHLKKEDLSDPLFYMEDSFKELLTTRETEAVLSDALLLSDNFIHSRLCVDEVLDHPFKSEMSFFSRLQHEGRTVVAEGVIDLLVDRGDEILVIDFKSDRFVDEEVHRFQIETYIDAARRLYKKKTSGLIVYLRDIARSIRYEG
ncbi:MAG TPA: UvrD-helicase domain-containing protein [Sphaerochaeta sp.]|nr:UvrD-helicase domain-containing protein [Sphaerochaeta sp.]